MKDSQGMSTFSFSKSTSMWGESGQYSVTLETSTWPYWRASIEGMEFSFQSQLEEILPIYAQFSCEDFVTLMLSIPYSEQL